MRDYFNNLQNWKVLNNTLDHWLIALALFSLIFFGLIAAKKFFIYELKKWETSKRFVQLDRILMRMVQRTNNFVVLLFAVYGGAQALDLSNKTDKTIRSLLIIAFLIQIAIWGQMLLSSFLKKIIARRMSEDASSVPVLSLIGFFIQISLWILVVLLILDNLGVNVTTLIAGLGVGGIAIALAAQKILEDLFSSLSIALDKPFTHGDFIVVGDMKGTVEKIGIKTTRVRSLSGELLIFSNSDLLQSRIQNYQRMYQRRILFTVSVIYETPPQKIRRVSEIIREAIEAQKLTRFDRAHFFKYGEYSLDFEAVYFVLDPDYNKYMDIQQAINLTIFEAFAKEGIEFSYPTQRQYFHPGDGPKEPHEKTKATRQP